MNIAKFLLIIIIVFFQSCENQKRIEKILDKTTVTDCLGKSIELYLPKNWEIPDRYSDNNGFIQTYSYPDKSYLIVMCDSVTELAIQPNVAENEFARVEKYNGFSLSYANVTADRKAEFDMAFEKMKSE